MIHHLKASEPLKSHNLTKHPQSFVHVFLFTLFFELFPYGGVVNVVGKADILRIVAAVLHIGPPAWERCQILVNKAPTWSFLKGVKCLVPRGRVSIDPYPSSHNHGSVEKWVHFGGDFPTDLIQPPFGGFETQGQI